MKNDLISADYPPNNFPLNVLTTKDAGIARALRRLSERDYAQTSLHSIVFDLKAFQQWYVDTVGETLDLQRITSKEIALFRDDTRKAGYSVPTVNRRLIMVRQLLDCAVQEGVIASNPAMGIKPLASQSLAPKGLKPQEIRKLLKEVELMRRPRDTAIVETLLGGGLRLAELIGLHVSDIKLTDRKCLLTIRHGKGNKARVVPLGQSARESLRIYLEHAKPSERVFPLTAAAIQKMIRKYGDRAGIEKLHPHQLRHTYAETYMASTHGDLVGLGQLLGHSSIKTTQVYTQQRLENLEEKIERMSY